MLAPSGGVRIPCGMIASKHGFQRDRKPGSEWGPRHLFPTPGRTGPQLLDNPFSGSALPLPVATSATIEPHRNGLEFRGCDHRARSSCKFGVRPIEPEG